MNEHYILDKAVLMVIEDEKIIVRFNGRFFKLEGEDVTDILIPILDYLKTGTTIKELYQMTPGDNHTRLEDIIGVLIERGWVKKHSIPVEKNSLLRTYASIGIKIEKIKELLDRKKIGVVSLFSSEELFNQFNYENMFDIEMITIMKEIKAEGIKEFIGSKDFIIVYEQEENIKFENIINSIAYELKKPYIFLSCSGFICEIGPMVIPPYTACRNCYRVRKRNNLNHFEENKIIENYLEKSNTLIQAKAYSTDPFAEYMAVCTVFNQIIQYFVKDSTWNFPKLIENVLEIDTFNCTFSINSLLKMPKCEVCGSSPYKVVPTKFWVKPIDYQGKEYDE